MNVAYENFSIYETENSVIFALRPEFDIKKLKLILGENFTRFLVDGKIYREIRFQKKISPINTRTSFCNGILKIEIPKKTESIMEIDFAKFDFENNEENDNYKNNDEKLTNGGR